MGAVNKADMEYQVGNNCRIQEENQSYSLSAADEESNVKDLYRRQKQQN